MSHARQLLGTYPRATTADIAVLAAAIDALNDCTQACTACATGDLSERNVADMVTCIRSCLDCADVCTATGAVITRQTGYDVPAAKLLLDACTAFCSSCGDECERHARMHEHCRICGEACRRCETACRELLAAMT